MASVGQGFRRYLSSCASSAFRSVKKTGGTSTGGSFRGSQASSVEVSAAKSAFSSSPQTSASTACPFASKCNPSSIHGARCYSSQIARLPREIAALQSLIPLYSATASSRLVSRLGTSGDSPILQDDEDGT